VKIGDDMYTIRYAFNFEAAHRLDSAFSKACVDTIHGHSYKVEVFIGAVMLDENGMVVDFGCVKEACQKIRDRLDHAIMLSREAVAKVLKTKTFGSKDIKKAKRIFGEKLVIIPKPTAEMMAKLFFWELRSDPKLSDALRSLRVSSVRVHETAHGWAEYS